MADFSGLTYQDPNLNLAAAYVRKFKAEKDSTEFYHVMIRAPAFNSAIQALGLNQKSPHDTPITFLPFSCWCDGGPYKEAYFNHHRHMIAVAPKGMFLESFWNKIEATNIPDDDYECKRYERIESVLELVNTMGYLSQRESDCNFTFPKERKKRNQKYKLSSDPVTKLSSKVLCEPRNMFGRSKITNLHPLAYETFLITSPKFLET